MRQPYGKTIASTVVYAHPRWYARHGYMVIIQDVRGRGESGGEFELFSTEIQDGEETLDWVTSLNGCDGNVGMYGFSYQGMTQLYGAMSAHPSLKTICPSMTAFDLYSDWAYENGAFCYQLNLSWAIQLAGETARLKGDFIAYKSLYLASRNLPIHDLPVSVEEALRKYCPSNFYFQWLAHTENDRYWGDLSPCSRWENVDLPMLHIGGWFDPYLRGTLNLYQEMTQKRQSKFLQCLYVGQWCHIPWGNTLGEKYYSQNANNFIDDVQVAWFDRFLKGKDNPNFPEHKVNLFQMESNKWLGLDEFPQETRLESQLPAQQTFYFQSTGLANLRDDAGKLVTNNQENHELQEDIIVHDWWRPVPSLGGHSAFPAGSFDRSELDNRSDIITYTSDWLTEDLDIVGEVEVEIYVGVESDLPTFDLSFVLSQVFPNGKVYNFSQSQMKVKNHNHRSFSAIKCKLQATCIKLKQNTALRISIMASNFPAHLDASLREKMTLKPTTINIFSGTTKPSNIKLYIV